MRTLQKITNAARRNEALSIGEARLAIATYDYLLAKLKVEEHPDKLKEVFKALDNSPIEYLGFENSPDNPEFVKWHKVMDNGSGLVLEADGEYELDNVGFEPPTSEL